MAKGNKGQKPDSKNQSVNDAQAAAESKAKAEQLARAEAEAKAAAEAKAKAEAEANRTDYRYRCKRQCWHKGELYNPNDTFVGAIAPYHFEPLDGGPITPPKNPDAPRRVRMTPAGPVEQPESTTPPMPIVVSPAHTDPNEEEDNA